MTEDANDTSDWLDGPPADADIVNEVFIEGFHALYKVQIGQLKTATLFDTDASINAISHVFQFSAATTQSDTHQ